MEGWEKLRSTFVQGDTGEDKATPVEGKLIAIISPKGGVGKTFLAVNLAVLYARQEGRVALLDLDLTAGDVALHLDLREGPTIVELLPYLRQGTTTALPRFTVRYGKGLEVLPAPARPELADVVSPNEVAMLLDIVPRTYPLAFIDTPSNTSDEILLEVLERAHQFVLVLTQDIAALRRAKMLLHVLNQLGLDPVRKVLPVLNMTSRQSPASPNQVASFLGFKEIVVLDADRPLVDRALFNGQPLVEMAENSPLARQIQEVARRLTPKSPSALSEGIPGLGRFPWSRWFKASRNAPQGMD